jgi:hypothetical protein
MKYARGMRRVETGRAGQLEDDGDEACNDEGNFRHFYMELARLKGGDDRQNFLNHDPIDLL